MDTNNHGDKVTNGDGADSGQLNCSFRISLDRDDSMDIDGVAETPQATFENLTSVDLSDEEGSLEDVLDHTFDGAFDEPYAIENLKQVKKKKWEFTQSCHENRKRGNKGIRRNERSTKSLTVQKSEEEDEDTNVRRKKWRTMQRFPDQAPGWEGNSYSEWY